MVVYFRALASMRTLTTLDLSRNQGTASTCVRALQRLTELSHLDLSNFQMLTDEELCTVASMPGLKGLHLRFCGRVGDLGMRALAHGLTGNTLAALNIQNCNQLTNEGVHHLSTIACLEVLNMRHCRNISDIALQSLATMNRLRSLNIGFCRKITNTGVQYLRRLWSLESLWLSFIQNLTDDGLQDIGELANLQHLDLGSCVQLTDKATLALKRLPMLNILNLSDIELLTDEGVKGLGTMPALATLHLHCCRNVSIEAMEHLNRVGIQVIDATA